MGTLYYLDVGIGLVLFFLFFSLLCTAANEMVEGWSKYRAQNLREAIRELMQTGSPPSTQANPAPLCGDELVKKFYNHPLIFGLFRGAYTELDKAGKEVVRLKSLPSYIPSRQFAQAMIDLIVNPPGFPPVLAAPSPGSTEPELIRRLRTALNDPNHPIDQRVREALRPLLDDAGQNLEKMYTSVEHWFNGAMDRASGWFKRRAQVVVFSVAVIAAAAFNADTLSVAGTLTHDPGLRQALVAQAQGAMKDGVTTPDFSKAKADLQALGLPLGWTLTSAGPSDPRVWRAPASFEDGKWWLWFVLKIIGILLTALAATLGAPFWFDMLNRVMVVRSTVKPEEKSPPEPPIDRR